MSVWAKLVIAGGLTFLISPAALIVGWFADMNALFWVSIAAVVLSLMLVIGAFVGYVASHLRNDVQT